MEENILERKYYELLKTVKTDEVAFKIANTLRDTERVDSIHAKAISIAMVLRGLAKTEGFIDIEEIIGNINISEEALDLLKDFVTDSFDLIEKLKGEFTLEQLLAFILFDSSLEDGKRSESTTPAGLSRLASEILDVKKADRVLELCSGQGRFAVEQYGMGDCSSYTGIELNYLAKYIAEIRGSILGDNYFFILSDALEYRVEEKADKLFSNYPFNLKILSMNGQKENIQKLLGIKEDITQKASSDWLFNATLVEQMNDTGKAVAIMTNGSSWNRNDERIRRYFIENGLIEAVIALPTKLFASTSIASTMIVFSKNNKTIRLVDAREVCTVERRNNVLEDTNIAEIMNLLSNDSVISVAKEVKEFANNEYILNPVRYFEEAPEIKNGVEFETIIKNITRGSQLKAADIDDLKSENETNYQYLMLSNISEGILDLADKQYLKEIPKKMEKYCVSNNSIVLSKTGTPTFKSAVATVSKGKKLLANGNIFVIELDESKVNPFYMQAFFASEIGLATMKSISSGSTITTISLDKLKKMIVPLPTLDEQTKLANRYAASMDELILLKKKIEKITSKMTHIFDEEV